MCGLLCCSSNWSYLTIHTHTHTHSHTHTHTHTHTHILNYAVKMTFSESVNQKARVVHGCLLRLR